MNPAITAAIIAATQQQEQKESLEARLRKANALGASSAIDFEPADTAEQQLLDQALAEGIIVRTASGRLYLSERRLADRREGMGFTLLLTLLVIGSVIASVFALLATSGG